MKHFGICLLLIVASNFSMVSAQRKNRLSADSISKKLDLYGLKNTGSVLFVHFDKTVYTNNEVAWFTAYLLDYQIRNNDFINVILVHNLTQTIALQEKFVCNSGFSFGKIELPDTLSAGNYSFIIYSSSIRAGKPLSVFTQPIVIKNTLSSSTKPVTKPGFNNLPEHKQVFSFENQSSVKPSLLTTKFMVTLAKTVVDDTLQVNIQAKQPDSAYLIVHNYKQLFFMLPIKLKSPGNTFKIALTDLPKGIAEVVILDSLQNPVAQKLFFAHYNQRNALQIITDKRSYQTREKVLLQLKLNNPEGIAISGYVSIACVQANRQPLNNKRDIESYVYLNHELGTLPVEETFSGSHMEKNVLEKILLTENWRNYNWSDLLKTTNTDAVIPDNSLTFTGKVTHYNKPLKKPASVFIIKDSSTTILQTDLKGKFTLAYHDLITAGNKKIHLLAGGGDPADYRIIITDPYESVNFMLANKDEISENKLPAPVSGKSDSTYDLKGLDHIITLKEVKITSKKDGTLYETKKINSCGDYVCKYGFLNCPLHSGDAQNVAAVNGKMYKSFDGTTADGSELSHPVFYQNCNLQKFSQGTFIDGIKISGTFYPANYEKENLAGPEYISTIYWNHLYKISPDGNLPIQFYTSDITGTFKIIVQGVTGNDVIYGENEINIVKK